jgi:glycosyltransferase involved in cell wall biosynthesis
VSDSKKKINVLFVGSFLNKSKSGGVGGQMFASKTLIESDLSSVIHWIKIDSTAHSNIKNSLVMRVFRAFSRLALFCFHMIFSRVDKVFIFTVHGASFKEKGLMAIIAKTFGKYVIIGPRSGIIIDDLKGPGRGFIEKVFSKVDVVICQSKAWKNIFESEFPHLSKERFVVVHNAIDTEKYKFEPSKKLNSIVEIVFIAWLDSNKGVFELVEAAEKLNNEGVQFKLTMCGHGKDFDAIETLIQQKKLNQLIDLKGWIYEKEKFEILARANIFVLPTYFEGMPNALLEAMASGLPSVATHVGSIPDMITNNAEGLLIEPKNVQQLKEALHFLIQDEPLRLRLGAAARAKVEKENSMEVVINNYRKVFLN